MKAHLGHTITIMIAISLFTSGCSKDDSSRSAETVEGKKHQDTIEQIYGLVDSTDSKDLANGVAQGVPSEDLALGAPEGVSKILSKLQSICSPQTSGDASDADQDHIKKDANISFDCNKSLGPITLSAKGNVHVKDQDDSAKIPNAGFSIDAPSIVVNVGLPNGKSIQRTSSTKVELSVNGKERQTIVHRTSSIKFSDKSREMIVDLESKSVADDVANPKQSGVTQFTSHIVIKGGEKDRDIKAETSNLKYSKDCSPKRFKEGTIKITTSDEGSKDIVLENCKIKR